MKFAAAQHKFCMKMRGWAATLASDPNNQSVSLTAPSQSTLPRVQRPDNSLSNKRFF